jgi:hypothetical protein
MPTAKTMSATIAMSTAEAMSAGKSVSPTPTVTTAPSLGKAVGGKRQANDHHHHEPLHISLLPPSSHADLACAGATNYTRN